MYYFDEEPVFMEYEGMEDSDDEEEESAAYYGILAARRRKSDRKTPKTLKDLCFSGIRSSSDFFLQIAKKTSLDPFISIPNSLKAELLELDLQQWERWEELLLNKKVSEMRIDVNLLSRASFLMSMILKKPQLKAFTCSGQPKSYLSVMRLLDPVGFTCAFSECFRNLQSLSIKSDFKCNDLHLETIGNNLLNLRTLSLELNGVTAKGISALSKLKHLQNFPFKSKSYTDCGVMTKLYNLCLQHLPKLLLFGWDEESDLAKRGCYDIALQDSNFCINFQSLPSPLELCLQQLVLHKVGVIPESITFPNLTSLVLWYPVVDFQLDARFAKVKDLTLIELSMPQHCRILSILGHQIRKLVIVSSGQNLFLDLILNLCPNLEEFHIPSTPDVMSCSLPLEPAVGLRTLKALSIDMVFFDDGSLVSKFSPGVLIQLLKAPNLQNLRLFSIELTDQDAEEIIRLLKEGQILQKLERMEVQHIWIERRGMNSDKFKWELRYRYDLVLESMALHCPRFVHYKEHPFE